MPQTKNHTCQVVLSVRTDYAYLILDKLKTYEFRRRIWAKPESVHGAFLYATAPTKKIVGWVEITKVLHASVPDLWRGRTPSGLEYPEFEKYFECVDMGYALELGEVRKFAPYNLDDLFPLNRAPQSFARLTAKSQVGLPPPCICDDEPYSVLHY